MYKINRIVGREILDSRGNPTVEVEVYLNSGISGRMMVPSGASTGAYEAKELRDGDPNRYRGLGVLKAVSYVNGELADAVKGLDVREQQYIDEKMIELDGTEDKSRLGANAILGVSLAAAHAASAASGKPLYRYLADTYLGADAPLSIPMPMVNIFSGGLHAGKNIDLQDFLVIPRGAADYLQALEMVSSVYWKVKDLLTEKGYISSLVADEGGFGPALPSNRYALELLVQAMEKIGLRPGTDMVIALDVAASHFYDSADNTYHLASEHRRLSSGEMIEMLADWAKDYPIYSIEDGLAEEDWSGWQALTARMGHKVQLVGDDLFTTHTVRIKKGMSMKAGNAVLVKMNQIGTLTETVNAIKLAKSAGYRTVISARSGETEDTTLADLAVGINGGQIKIGSLSRSSRLSKYNRLIKIHEELNGAFDAEVIPAVN